MKQFFLFAATAGLLLFAFTGHAKKKGTGSDRTAWNNLKVLQENREPANCTLTPYAASQLTDKYDGRGFDSKYVKILNGEWKFNWVSKPADRVMGFYKVDFDDSKWKNITVPSNWQMEGFGMPIYINTRYPFPKKQPEAPTKYNPVGAYRRSFTIPTDWNNRVTYINFAGVESAFYIWVNGQRVGYSQGSRTAAKFNVTKYLKPGKNSLAVEVYRWSDGSYLECQDFWRLSGIFRDVTLMSRSKVHIRDYSVVQTLSSDYKTAVFGLEAELINLSAKSITKTISYKLNDAQTGTLVDKGSKQIVVKAKGSTKVKFANKSIKGLKFWTSETPNLYKLTIAQIDTQTKKLDEKLPQTVGFRSCEIKDGLFKLNGVAILFRGANRHEHDQFRGHYVLPSDMKKDIVLLKQHNFNAVRNCHYPNSVAWYELCAKEGILLWDEANLESHAYGYGKTSLAKNSKWKEAFVERNQRMVIRSKNNPSVVVWSLGNECGDGINMEASLDWIHEYDPTRPVHSERATYGPNTDIVSTMYTWPDGMAKYANKKQTRPFIICEYTHAMGNSNGNIKEYFDVFNKKNHAQGGFVWDWIDQGLAQPIPSNKGQVHAVGNRFIPVDEWKNDAKVFQSYGGWYEDKGRAHDGNFCMNGLISAERLLHSGIQALKKEQQYFYIHDFNAQSKSVKITNRFHFTNPLKRYSGNWNVVDSRGVILSKGNIAALNLKPTETKALKLIGFKAATSKQDLFLNISINLKGASDWAPAGYQVAWEQFELVTKPVVANLSKTSGKLKLTDGPKVATIVGKNFTLEFDKKSGALTSWKSKGVNLLAAPLKPNFWRAPNDNDRGAGLQNKLKMWRDQPSVTTEFKIKPYSGNFLKVTTRFKLNNSCGNLIVVYTVSPAGEVKVDYDFTRGKQKQIIPRVGMSLAMPASFDTVSWFGRGPKSTFNDRLQQPVGTFKSTVSKDWEEFSRPQEGGNKMDLRWIKLTDDMGRGLVAIADKKYLQGSVNFYNSRQIDSKGYTWQLHKEGKTWFNIDTAQMGLGGVDSWGARPFDTYQLKGKKYTFSFILKPTL